MGLKYFVNDTKNININAITSFLKDMDSLFIEPLQTRNYFDTFESLSEKFYLRGKLIYCKNENNKLIGLAIIYANNLLFKYAYETYIAVLNEYAGIGIASELMKIEISLSKSLGMGGLMTNCHKDNIVKINLNKKLGFTEILDQEEILKFQKMNSKWNGKVFFKIDFR